MRDVNRNFSKVRWASVVGIHLYLSFLFDTVPYSMLSRSRFRRNLSSAVPVKKSRRPTGSPVFEQLNLERLNKSAQSISRADELIRQAKHQLEHTRGILDKSSALLSPKKWK